MAAKLKDGIFLGDFEAAQDLEFIVANKITRIINCVGREVANSWERSGIRYLTYYWPESGNCIVFDDSNAVLDETYSFIEEALDVGESVLIHSTDGVSRATFCACVYFMLKYRWTLTKTFNYLTSKRPDLQPKPGFQRQLQALDASLQKVARGGARGSSDPNLRRCAEWDPALIPHEATSGTTDDDELVLANTYLNSQAAPEELVIAAQSSTSLPRALQGGGRSGSSPRSAPGRRSLSWIDDMKRGAMTAHADVPVSPGSRRPTVERPPSASYNSLALGPGWIDPTGAAQAQGGNGYSGGSRAAGATLVAPSISGTVSAVAAALPLPSSHASHGPVRPILKGSAAWSEVRARGRAVASNSASAVGLGATSGTASAEGSMSGSVGEEAGRVPPVATVRPRDREGRDSRGVVDEERERARDRERTAQGQGGRPPSQTTPRPTSNGGGGGASQAQAIGQGQGQGSAQAAALVNAQAQAASWSSTSVGMGMQQPGYGMSGRFGASGAGAMPSSGQGREREGGGVGPVRAVHGMKGQGQGQVTDLGATFGAPGARGNTLLNESLASLSQANFSKTLGMQYGGGGERERGQSSGRAWEAQQAAMSSLSSTLNGSMPLNGSMNGSLGQSLGGSNASIQLGQQPGRSASSRVRGYSPGPGRIKGGTGPSGGPAQGGSASLPAVQAGGGGGPGLSQQEEGGGSGRPGSGRMPTAPQAQAPAGGAVSGPSPRPSSSSSSSLMPQMLVRQSGLVQYVSHSSGLGMTQPATGSVPGGAYGYPPGHGQGQGQGRQSASQSLAASVYGGSGGAGGVGAVRPSSASRSAVALPVGQPVGQVGAGPFLGATAPAIGGAGTRPGSGRPAQPVATTPGHSTVQLLSARGGEYSDERGLRGVQPGTAQGGSYGKLQGTGTGVGGSLMMSGNIGAGGGGQGQGRPLSATMVMMPGNANANGQVGGGRLSAASSAANANATATQLYMSGGGGGVSHQGQGQGRGASQGGMGSIGGSQPYGSAYGSLTMGSASARPSSSGGGTRQGQGAVNGLWTGVGAVGAVPVGAVPVGGGAPAQSGRVR